MAKAPGHEIRLSYLNHPFWRGECLRIALTMARIPFCDDRLDWGALCAKGWFPGCMPVLEMDGRLIGMDPQIATVVGQLTGFYPTDASGVEAFGRVFGILTNITDVLTGVQERDPQRKIAIRMGLVSAEGAVTRELMQLEQLLHRAMYITGEGFTVADLACWRACGWLSSGILDGVPLDYVATTLPRLMEHHRRIDGMPEVQQWMRAHPANYGR
jgi:glutathione S-transferase